MTGTGGRDHGARDRGARIRATAQQGFTAGAGAYERGRPSYPADAVAHVVGQLRLGPGGRLLDLAAGTGKLTRLLQATGADVVAVEPVDAMRVTLADVCPGADVRDGTAESIPLEDGAVDAVTVGQAFHWFDAPAALAEIARVLRPGGGLALLWNSRDDSVPWVAELSRVIRWNAGQIPTYDAGDERWQDVIAASGRFGPVEFRRFRYDQELDAETLVDRVASVSYIATMPPDERATVLDGVRTLVAGFPPRFVLPHQTFVYTCSRI